MWKSQIIKFRNHQYIHRESLILFNYLRKEKTDTCGEKKSTWYIHEIIQIGLQGSQAWLNHVSICRVC